MLQINLKFVKLLIDKEIILILDIARKPFTLTVYCIFFIVYSSIFTFTGNQLKK